MKKLLRFLVVVAVLLIFKSGMSFIGNGSTIASVNINSMSDAKKLIASNLDNVNQKFSFYAPSDVYDNFNTDTIENVIDSNPLYIAYGGIAYKINKSSDSSSNLIEISLNYDLGRNKVLSMKKATEKEASKVITSIIKKDMTVYEKEKAIHDYICQNVKYVLSSDPAIYTDYGALINKKAVCQGYALAFYRLCTLASVPCKYISGYGADFLTKKVDGHAWNMVKLDGNWYHVDCTWDSGNNYYLYFNISDNDIGRDHSWTRSSYPVSQKSYKNPGIKKLPTFSDSAKLQDFLISQGKNNPKDVTFITINIDASIDSLSSYFNNYRSFNVSTATLGVYSVYHLTIR